MERGEITMHYLFFDIEGANNYDFVAKMCTFGYVISTSDYQLIHKSDIVINPQSFFEHHLIKHKMAAYDLKTYKKSPTFRYYYPKIKDILENKNQLIIGWSVENDVKYLYDACKRYHLKQIKFKFLDLQKLIMLLDKQDNVASLENTCEKLSINKVILHKSDEDAYLTMKIAKVITKKLNTSLEKLCLQYPNCLSNVDEYIKHLPTQMEIENKIKKKKIYNIIKNNKIKISMTNNYLPENTICCFDVDLIEKYFDEIKEIIFLFKHCGISCTTNLKEANYYVYLNNPTQLSTNNNNQLICNLEFKKLLKIIEKNKVM